MKYIIVLILIIIVFIVLTQSQIIKNKSIIINKNLNLNKNISTKYRPLIIKYFANDKFKHHQYFQNAFNIVNYKSKGLIQFKQIQDPLNSDIVYFLDNDYLITKGFSFYLRNWQEFDQKDKLAINLQKCNISSNKMFPSTLVINKSTKTEIKRFFDKYKPLITKSNMEDSKGINIVDDYETINLKQSVILQQIIKNPLLSNDRHFKIRTYLLLICHDKTLQCYTSDNGFIGYAKDPWNSDKLNYKTVIASPHWNDKKSNLKYDFNPELFDLYSLQQKWGNDFYLHIMKQIKTKIKLIINCLFNQAKRLKCDDNKFFSISGLDFILDDDLNVFFIEMNRSPGTSLYDSHNQHHIKFERSYSYDIWADAIFIVINKLYNFPIKTSDRWQHIE
jgi:hypothetical protein